MDPQFADNIWNTIRHAISEIMNRNISNLSFEQLYRFSYNMLLHKHGDFLYKGLLDLLTEHLQGVAALISDADSEDFLPEIKRQWGWFSLSLADVRDVLMYMDRHYVKSKQKKTVHELGLSLFRDVVIRKSTILPRLTGTLLGSIDKERNGEAVDTHLIRAITRMLAELGNDKLGKSFYVNVFEEDFLERTKRFYAREARLYLSETTCSDYLRKANKRIQEEHMRVESYLEPRTDSRVRKVAEVELISKYMTRLVDMENSGLIWMLRNDKIADLRLMYSLFRDIKKGEETLRTKLKDEVLERGTDLVQDPENIGDPASLINAILALKDKYDKIINYAFYVPATGSPEVVTNAAGSTNSAVGHADHAGATFEKRAFSSSGNEAAVNATMSDSSVARSSMPTGGASMSITGATNDTAVVILPYADKHPDKRFVSAVNEAFERFINSFSRAAEYISLYVDKLLRKDLKGSNDDEIEEKLDAVMTLFRYLHEKDEFERYYKQHLTKRLLHARTASSDAERSFISKMKTECGYMYTSKMEVMFNDMKTSEETSKAFKSKIIAEHTDMRGIDLSVAVLTTMSWPVTTAPDVVLPFAAAHCTNKFEDYYYGQHEGRRLTWQNSLGTTEIRARFKDRSREYDLYSVSVYSMCVLMLFNDADCLTYQQIADATRIPEKDLIRHLQSVSLTKYRVLRKEPLEKDVKPTDKFYFNDDFSCRSRRVKMQVISAKKEDERERNQTKGRIDDDRRPVIDTVIVRIMKHRKVLEHNKLIVEVTSQLTSSFEPNPQDIKKRIESLVDREYLERQKDNRQVYQYLA